MKAMTSKTLEKPVEKMKLEKVADKLYVPVDFEKNHDYFADENAVKAYRGVTTILGVINKPMLIQWAANMACDFVDGFIKEAAIHANWQALLEDGTWDRIIKEARVAHRKKKEAAGEAGTEVHADIEGLIKSAIDTCGGYVCPITDMTNLKPQVKQFLDWANANNVQFLASEKRLYSETNWYAGTADFVCMIGKKLYVGDVKTSSAIYPEHFIQASAYANALVEQGEYSNFDGVIIVNIPKKGGLNVKENYDLKGNFECFKAALTLHKYLNN